MTPLQQAAYTLLDAINPQGFHKAEMLRKALSDEMAQAVEPVAWGMMKNGLMLDIICPDEHESFEGDYTIPLYTHPAPPTTFQDELVILTAIALYEFQEATNCDTAAQFKAQQVAVPMTEDEIEAACRFIEPSLDGPIAYDLLIARAIEKHHGIGVKQ